MKPNTFRYVVTASILAKLACLVLIMLVVPPPLRKLFVPVVVVAIVVQSALLWRQTRQARRSRPAAESAHLRE